MLLAPPVYEEAKLWNEITSIMSLQEVSINLQREFWRRSLANLSKLDIKKIKPNMHLNSLFRLFVADCRIYVADSLPRNIVALKIVFASSLNLSHIE